MQLQVGVNKYKFMHYTFQIMLIMFTKLKDSVFQIHIVTYHTQIQVSLK